MPANLTLPRQTTKYFTVHGQPVTITGVQGTQGFEPDRQSIVSPNCAISFVAAECLVLMAKNTVHELVVDGCPIKFVKATFNQSG